VKSRDRLAERCPNLIRAGFVIFLYSMLMDVADLLLSPS